MFQAVPTHQLEWGKNHVAVWLVIQAVYLPHKVPLEWVDHKKMNKPQTYKSFNSFWPSKNPQNGHYRRDLYRDGLQCSMLSHQGLLLHGIRRPPGIVNYKFQQYFEGPTFDRHRTNSDLWDQNAIERSHMSTNVFNFFLHDINKINLYQSLKVFMLKINHLQLSLQVLNLGCCSPRRLSRSKRSWALICSRCLQDVIFFNLLTLWNCKNINVIH